MSHFKSHTRALDIRTLGILERLMALYGLLWILQSHCRYDGALLVHLRHHLSSHLCVFIRLIGAWDLPEYLDREGPVGYVVIVM